MTNKEVIQRVQSLYSKGVESDDSRLTSRHIFNKLQTVRAKLLTQEINKKQKVSQWSYQVLPCVEVIQVSAHECNCIPTLGCKYYRTKHKMPEPITGYDSHVIQSITTLDGRVQFSPTSWKGKKWKQGSKFTSNKPDYFIRNAYIYLTSNIEKLEVITVELLAEDVVQVYNFPSYCNERPDACTGIIPIPVVDCQPIMDKDFPLDLDLIDTCILLSAQELVEIFTRQREDRTNNTADNINSNEK